MRLKLIVVEYFIDDFVGLFSDCLLEILMKVFSGLHKL